MKAQRQIKKVIEHAHIKGMNYCLTTVKKHEYKQSEASCTLNNSLKSADE